MSELKAVLTAKEIKEYKEQVKGDRLLLTFKKALEKISQKEWGKHKVILLVAKDGAEKIAPRPRDFTHNYYTALKDKLSIGLSLDSSGMLSALPTVREYRYNGRTKKIKGIEVLIYEEI